MHPRLRKTYQYLSEKFLEVIIRDHNLLSIETHREKMLAFLPRTVNDELKNKVKHAWLNKIASLPTDENDEEHARLSEDLFNTFKERYAQWKRDGKIKQTDLSVEALVLTYLYPRIDVNVSTGINHLLKSPWCVHPKTGKLIFFQKLDS